MNLLCKLTYCRVHKCLVPISVDITMFVYKNKLKPVTYRYRLPNPCAWSITELRHLCYWGLRCFCVQIGRLPSPKERCGNKAFCYLTNQRPCFVTIATRVKRNMFLKTRSPTLYIGIQHVLISICKSVKIRGQKFWLEILYPPPLKVGIGVRSCQLTAIDGIAILSHYELASAMSLWSFSSWVIGYCK